jgi:hypothetical protein
MCYSQLEPWGAERDDLRAAIVASTVANTARDPKRRRKPFAPADFMPKFAEQEQPSTERLLSQVEKWNVLFGGKDLRKG